MQQASGSVIGAGGCILAPLRYHWLRRHRCCDRLGTSDKSAYPLIYQRFSFSPNCEGQVIPKEQMHKNH